MSVVMKDEVDKVRARIVKKLSKRDYFQLDRAALPDGPEQYITGFVREEFTLLEVEEDGTVKLCFITTPYYGRYGPRVMAKRRPNGRYWFISNAYADTLPERVTDAMEALAAGTSNLPRFDPNDISRIYD